MLRGPPRHAPVLALKTPPPLLTDTPLFLPLLLLTKANTRGVGALNPLPSYCLGAGIGTPFLHHGLFAAGRPAHGFAIDGCGGRASSFTSLERG